MIFWIIHIAVIGVLSYTVQARMKSSFHPLLFWIGLIIKLFSGILLGYLYFEYYGQGDTIHLFELAKSYSLESIQNQPRERFFVWIISPIVWLTGGSYWITSIWLSFLGFLACWYATTSLSEIFPEIKLPIATCLLLVPSVVFWSSGILKDTVSFSALVLSIVLVVKLYRNQRLLFIDLILLIFSLILLFKIKHYLLITVLIFSSILIFSILLRKIKTRLKWPLAITVLAIILISTQFIHPYLRVDRIAQTIYENNEAIASQTSPENRIIVLENESFMSLINKVPISIYTGLLRPSILDSTSSLGWVHRIENFILTVLIFLSLMLIIKEKHEFDLPLLFSSIFCIVLLGTLLPLTSPNFGTLVRYKNAYFPFILLISSILPYRYLSSN
ncbi:hypothetical protein [Ekhidna sp.]